MAAQVEVVFENGHMYTQVSSSLGVHLLKSNAEEEEEEEEDFVIVLSEWVTTVGYRFSDWLFEIFTGYCGSLPPF